VRPGTPGFIGSQLRFAREARDITAVALADILGVTHAAVSQYESGMQTPSPAVMQQMATALNLPFDHFLSKEVPDVGTIFFRSLNSATRRSRLRAERRFQWLRKICAVLWTFVEAPRVCFPALILPTDPREISDQDIEDIAASVRSQWEMTEDPIGNVVWLLENHGFIVARQLFDSETLDAFSEWCESEARPYLVLSTNKASAVRSRFDALHEFGHMLLHRKLPSSWLGEKEKLQLLEKQAHRFASAFLLPRNSFAADLRTVSLDALLTLKMKWRVSVAAMCRRLVDIGFISDSEYSRLCRNMSRRGWRRNEPYDDAIPIERPYYLQRSFEVLAKEGLLHQAMLERKTQLFVSEIQELVSADDDWLLQLVKNRAEESCLQPQLLRFPRSPE
jgi:Zn-dependent peptidase ImmA (M78 family)/DNA-binding XRE family transcriptional regulator